MVVLASFLAGGCVSLEGVSLAKSDFGVEELTPQSQDQTSAEDNPGEHTVSNLLLIGTVSALRRFDDESASRFYERYAEFAERLHPGRAPAYSEQDFRERIAGWTKLKLLSIPLVIATYDYTLVPSDIQATIRFPSVFGTLMVQESGDLVVAKSNEDGYFLIVGVLCKDLEDYADCAGKYRKGLFDATTGSELSCSSLEPKESGHRIDIASYQAIE